MNPFKMIKSLFGSSPCFAPLACADRVRNGESILVDVREPGEWRGGVAQHAQLLPLSDLTGSRKQWDTFLAETAGREILVYCASGGRSGIAARVLTSEGFRSANTGGLTDWAAAGWPITRPTTQ